MGARLEISGTPAGGDCKVRLDGQEVQRALRGLSLDMRDHDELPTATLDVMVVEVPGVDTRVQAVVAPEAHELLVRLGWTPPPAAPAGD